jgi:hypothetical protein
VVDLEIAEWKESNFCICCRALIDAFL